jgi:hypothetical protein
MPLFDSVDFTAFKPFFNSFLTEFMFFCVIVLAYSQLSPSILEQNIPRQILG